MSAKQGGIVVISVAGLRLPMLAAIARGHDRSPFSHCPASARIGEINAPGILIRAAALELPVLAAVTCGQDRSVESHRPAGVCIGEINTQ